MKIIATPIKDVIIIELEVVEDGNCQNIEVFNAEKFEELTSIKTNFVQDNQSRSSYGVIRGLHFQRPPHAQAKLVRCFEGAVLDVALDIRLGSPTYGKHVAAELTGDNHRMMYIPKGFAHGFSVLSDKAIFQYKCDDYYAPATEDGINIQDTDLSIDWRIPADKAILSTKDTQQTYFKNFKSTFSY